MWSWEWVLFISLYYKYACTFDVHGFLTISLLSNCGHTFPLTQASGEKQEQPSRDVPPFWSSNFTKDTIRVAANFASSIARMQWEGFPASENFPHSFLQKEHAPRLPYNCIANHILGAQQSPLDAHFLSSISGSAHGNYYCNLTLKALPTFAAIHTCVYVATNNSTLSFWPCQH